MPIDVSQPFSQTAAKEVFTSLMKGEYNDTEIALFLANLAKRGETAEEISGAAAALRSLALPITINCPSDAIDTCGTGGDNAQTFNISTTVALVLAACGVKVAKHGNRAASSKSGSADMLESLGVNIETSPQQVENCIRECNIGFLFAPTYHHAMKKVAPVRKALGIRTIFNLLGPLANPLGIKRQLLGVFSKDWLEPMSEALENLGTERAIVVHGAGGLDEFSLAGDNHYCWLGKSLQTLHPKDIGLAPAPLSALKGGTPQENALITHHILDGSLCDAKRDTVLLNTAAGLLVAQKVSTWKEGIEMAEMSIDSGHALKTMQALIEVSNQRS